MPDKPKGQPIPWTDDDLDALSQITPADLKAAANRWQVDAPPWAKKLLEATPTEEPNA